MLGQLRMSPYVRALLDERNNPEQADAEVLLWSLGCESGLAHVVTVLAHTLTF